LKDFFLPYLLHLADNALILGHRNSEWCGHGPVLEQDIAITNIALDHIGQARNFFQYAAIVKDDGSTEDSLAYLRHEREFRNCLLVEQPNLNWAQTIVRQFFFSNYQSLLFTELAVSKDEQLSAISNKALKEVTYHLRWSSEWVIRLGDGTNESHQLMLHALDELWPYTGELFLPSDFELTAKEETVGPDISLLKEPWEKKLKEIFEEAGLPVPPPGFSHKGGKQGLHTENLGYILAELQYIQRAYPGSNW
jgi:ring-1,2-phenylacetyl-CoA epoxidase subunit PaaC